MQLAVAFLDRMLEGEARPIAGAIFRDQRGTRMQVIEMAASEDHPNGLIALVEIQDSKSSKPGLSKAVTTAREQVAYRAKGRVKSRDLNLAQKLATLRSNHASLKNEENVIRTAQPDVESENPNLPTAEELAALRQRTATPQN